MKITICGKGGCEKSTVTSLLAKEFARMGKAVLVVDSDESNFGLHRQLGVELPRDFTEYFGGKDKAFKKMMAGEILDTVKLSAFAEKFFSQAFTISEIPQEYVAKKDGVMLISSGKIHRANEGCACTIQERLWELRKDKGLNLEELSKLTGISKSALGSYEKEDFKEINHGNLITLADFYGVSVDYLLCRIENREQINTPLTELHLNDEMVALLKSGRINNRLLCELATHKDFIKFLADIEIYVDGIATIRLPTKSPFPGQGKRQRACPPAQGKIYHGR